MIFGQLLTLFLFIYLIVLPFLNKKNEVIKKLIRDFAVPLPKIHQTIMFVFATLVMLVMDSSKQWEIYEFAFGMIFLLILLYPDNPTIYESDEDSV